MRRRLDKQLNELNDQIILLGGMCEKAISLANEALMNHNTQAAQATRNLRDQIFDHVKQAENLCMRCLLLEQPIAQDLRSVSAALKMLTDLNRIGEICSDMAEATTYTDKHLLLNKLDDMAKGTSDMLHQAIDAYVDEDPAKAEDVIRYDDTIDQLFLATRNDIIQLIQTHPEEGDYAVDLVIIAKYYEKIGDHCVSLASWVNYSITGNAEGKSI